MPHSTGRLRAADARWQRAGYIGSDGLRGEVADIDALLAGCLRQRRGVGVGHGLAFGLLLLAIPLRPAQVSRHLANLPLLDDARLLLYVPRLLLDGFAQPRVLFFHEPQTLSSFFDDSCDGWIDERYRLYRSQRKMNWSLRSLPRSVRPSLFLKMQWPTGRFTSRLALNRCKKRGGII